MKKFNRLPTEIENFNWQWLNFNWQPTSGPPYSDPHSIICCAKEARALIVMHWLNECNLSCKIVKNWRIIGLNRAKKNSVRGLYIVIKKKKNSASCLPQTWCTKSIFKRLVHTQPDLSPRFNCKVNLSNTKNPAWFLVLASLLDRNATCKFFGCQRGL